MAAVGLALVLPVSADGGGQGATAWIDVHADAACTPTGYRLSRSPHDAWNTPLPWRAGLPDRLLHHLGHRR